MNEEAAPMEDIKIDTHCYVCHGKFIEGPAVITSKCGVSFHESCAKKVVSCPACSENLLEHFLTQKAKKKLVRKDRVFTMLLLALPFLIIELLIALFSMMGDEEGFWAMTLSEPFSFAFILDLIVLAIGIIIGLLVLAKFGYKPEYRTLNAIAIDAKGPTPGVANEQMFTCGYGTKENPIPFGDVSIQSKHAVARGNIVQVHVDRLVIRPDSTYTWVNPLFIKKLKPEKNPQSSDAETLEKIWKSSGRAKIMPEEEALEERNCVTCEGPLQYVDQYKAWYCTACGKYEDQ